MSGWERAADAMYRRLGRAYYEIEWLAEDAVEQVNRERDTLLKVLPSDVKLSCNKQKPHVGELSPGCKTCAEGTWSCLFINRVCNAPCFYCPIDKRVHGDEPPTASGLIFNDPKTYCDYIETFGFKGVGISGGEPLLALPKALSYLKALRDRFGASLYIWLYSNGILATSEKLKQLADAGLDEIRFDISAHDYTLDAVELAIPLFKKVSIEIPMIPEDEARLRNLLPKLAEMGVAHLHLHQLTANEVSYQRFEGRKYTFLHQPEFAVSQSEPAALRLLAHVAESVPGLPVQYCSRPYKKQSQGNGRRFRAVDAATEDWLANDAPTPNGFLRRVTHPGDPAAPLVAEDEAELSKKDKLETPDPSALPVSLAYFDPVIRERTSGSALELEVELKTGKRYYLGREPIRDFGPLSDRETQLLQALVFEMIELDEAVELIEETNDPKEKSRMQMILGYERERVGNGPLL